MSNPDDKNGANGPTEEEVKKAAEPTQQSQGDPTTTLRTELEDMKKQYLYLRADFDNYRKQVIKERSDLIKFGGEPIFREFLNVLDNLDRATTSELKAETMATYKSGVDLILTQMKKAFERFGVEEIDSKGQPFDPGMHEAVTSEVNPQLPPNVVTQVLKKAYRLHGKIIRPAQVVVNTTQKEG